MRNIVVSCLLLFSLMVPAIVLAQSAGTMLSGYVYDEFGEMVNVPVMEIDASNRIVNQTITDVNGNFSIRLKDPKDRIRVAMVGYKPAILPINGTSYKIKMISATKLGDIVVTAKKKFEGGGLAIPQREISSATQSIDAKEFEGLPFTTIDEALQGRIAGLDIVANSGNLGSGTSMRLRGVSSISGNSEPLIVVDGNVFATDDSKSFDFNNANDEKFAQLLNVNPEDIESISVLKDAAATAIWGSQGANGVVAIKTKRGARGNTKVTYSYRTTLTKQPTGYKMMNGDEYTMLMKEAYFNTALSDAAANIREFNYDPTYSEYQMYNNNTDWLKAVIQIGDFQNHFVSIMGGGERANFRISGGYDKEIGSIIAQSLERFSTRVALDYFVSDRIKFVSNFSMTYTDNQKNSGDLLGIAYKKMPNLSIYEQDPNGVSTGEYYNMLTSASNELKDQRDMVNPVALAYQATNRERSNSIQPEFKLDYNLLGTEGEETQLKYEGQILFDIFNKSNNAFYPVTLVTAGWANDKANSSADDEYKKLAITTRHTMTFTPHFVNKDHSLLMLLRGEMETDNSSSQSTAIHGLPTGTVTSTAADALINGFSTSAGQGRSIYFAFSTHYAYKGKYMADFTLRRDGSTRFGPQRRWGNFPGMSLRWNASDEDFLKDIKWLSMLSIRPGWGKVGKQPDADYLYFSKYTPDDSYMGIPSIYPSNIRLSNLKWESKETWNIGFDLGFFDDKFRTDINLYNQNTTDNLMPDRKIPTSSGYSSLSVQNMGSMTNNGWELNMNSNGLIKKGKNFSIDFNLSFANNINKITEMDPMVLASLNGTFDRKNGSYLSRVQLNNAFGSIFGFRYQNVYQYSKYSETEVVGVSGPNAPVVRNAAGKVVLDENGRIKPMMFGYGYAKPYEFKGGDAKYEDINHDGNINELDIVYLGSSLPKITGGFGIKVIYGRLQLNNQFNFRAGNKIINKARMNAESMFNNNNQSRAVNWRWRTEGDLTNVPRALFDYGYNFLGSDRFVEDGSFMRLNYSQLSYSMDPKLIRSLGLSQVRINVSANNLFCLTNYSGSDPEVGYGNYGVVSDNAQTPRSKSITAGVTIAF